MHAQANLLVARMIGLAVTPEVTVRETADGCRIETSLVEDPLAASLCRTYSFVLVALWAAALCYWVLGLPGMAPSEPGPSPWLWIATLSASGLSLLWYMTVGARRHVVEVDTLRERVRYGFGRGDRVEFLPGAVDFADIRDLVLTRPRRGADLKLCLRLKGASRPLEVARGSESVLNAVYDRLSRDLLPAEDRVAGRRLKAACPGRRMTHSFPPLGPNEIHA